MVHPSAAPRCTVTLRRFVGPLATELFLHVAPTQAAPAAAQADALYRAAADALAEHGGRPAHVVRHTALYRDIAADIDAVRAARLRLVDDWAAAVTDIQQPPLNDEAALEVLMHAVVPEDGASTARLLTTDGDGHSAMLLGVGADLRMYAGNVIGEGDDAAEQTRTAFERAERLLERGGMSFGDVARTWIYLRDIERDYPALNAARRAFFASRDVTPPPASTGIAGGPAARDSNLCLGFYALRAGAGVARVTMTSPTLNEAATYGADFVRGTRVDEANRVALHVSGTASINEKGETAHPGNVEAQAKRMLVNLEALLARQGATFKDVVCATTYLKHRDDAECLRSVFATAGFEGFPNPLVWAPVCRADLLCETELLALRPTA